MVLIDKSMRALDRVGNLVKGLYVLGYDSGGFFVNTHVNLIVGCCAGRNMTFARRAVGEAMKPAKKAEE